MADVQVKKCSICGHDAPVVVLPNEVVGGSVEVLTCIRCDRLACEGCGTYILDGKATRCPQPECRRPIPPLKKDWRF